jgi:hypothetical protein
MPRKITSGRVGGQVLGNLSTENNTFSSVEANTSIALAPNGTGIVESISAFEVKSANAVRFADLDSSAFVGLRSPDTIGTSFTLVLPSADGSANDVLTTNGSGTLSFAGATLEISNQTADPINTYYPLMSTSTSGNIGTINTSDTKLSFNTNSGQLSATSFSGSLNGNLTSNSVDINGGSIDGTAVGAGTASTGAFTTLTATSITETSSITYKENINPITNALDSILSLTGVTYDRKDGSRKNEAGLIAEETAKILPNVVTYKDGAPEGINYTKLSAYLIEAVKELTREINNLKGK